MITKCLHKNLYQLMKQGIEIQPMIYSLDRSLRPPGPQKRLPFLILPSARTHSPDERAIRHVAEGSLQTCATLREVAERLLVVLDVSAVEDDAEGLLGKEIQCGGRRRRGGQGCHAWFFLFLVFVARLASTWAAFRKSVLNERRVTEGGRH